MLLIREAPGSNFGPETGYPDRIFVHFLSPFRQMPGCYLTLGHDRFFSHPFQFTRRYIVCVTKKALLNKLQINRMVKGVFQPAYSKINISCLPRAAFLNLFTLEEPLK
jgi:hypothetical protein